MSVELNGTWIHRSYRNDQQHSSGAGVILATPWAPPGRFEVDTAVDGTVTGRKWGQRKWGQAQ
jgi:hypothetical protein